MLNLIDPKRWTDGFKDAYAGQPPKPVTDDDHSYAAGRVEGEALRLQHQQEYQQHLFGGRRIRPEPQDSA